MKSKVEQAGRLWEDVLHDDVTVNIDFQFDELPEGYIGGARPNMLRANYGDAVQQFGLDQVSTDDQTAVANLPTYRDRKGNMSISRLINLTSTQNGSHTDTSTKNLWLTRANAKALGIVAGDDQTVDAAIRLNSNAKWDLYAPNGIRSGRYDFVGTVVHELGHTLGFLSGVDVLDFYASQKIYHSDVYYDYVTSMDLFRQSSETKGQGQIDWTLYPENIHSDAEYFSIDGGHKKIADFTERDSRIFETDYYQLSHFNKEENSVMGPVLYSGTRAESISEKDLRLMDVIGWDRAVGNRTNYTKSSVSYTTESDSFDTALSWGSWSRTSYTYNFWQEGSFLASQAGGPAETQDVPEPGMILGLSVISLFRLKSLRKHA